MIQFNFEALSHIGLTPAILNQLFQLTTDLPNDELVIARVIETQRNKIVCDNGNTKITLTIPHHSGKDALKSNYPPIVGDWCLLDQANEKHHIAAIMPAHSELARRQADGKVQIIANNIDTAILVMGLDHDFNLRRLERYLTLVSSANIRPVIVLSKSDLCENVEQRIEAIRNRIPDDIPIIAMNTLDDSAGSSLSDWLGVGQTIVLLGSSGVGKSSLTNTLCLSQQAVGSVRQGDDKGRHTTTHRSLHLCKSGACIIDTPGLRSLQLDIDTDAVITGFSDIERFALSCRFRNCQHRDEPDCAVRQHVDADRLKNYHKLVRESSRLEQTPLERIAERSKWKALVKSIKTKNRLMQN